MSETQNEAPEPTGDEVPDGTQLPDEGAEEVDESGDAGVADDGTEEWYREGEA